MKPTRLDRIMHELEVLQNDADGIIDAHVNAYLARHPEIASWGEAKFALLPSPQARPSIALRRSKSCAPTGKDR